ncbi:MAG: efflux RND transporter periplasmic adaptor subunit [Alphaproteobacteria bacterium]
MNDSGPDRRTEQRPARRGLVTWVIVLAVLGVGAAVWHWIGPHVRGLSSSSTIAQAGAAPPVTVSHPLKMDITVWNEFTGQFAAVEDVEIRARVSGYLTEIDFKDGQDVKQGDLLFVIDPRPFQADLQQAEANLERDKAQVVRADADLKRYAELAKKDFASQQQLETARATADAAAATVKADEAAVAQAKLNLEFTHITAPVGGRISNHLVSLGNLVIGGSSATTTLLTTIVSLDPIYLYFDTDENDYLSYRRAVVAGTIPSPITSMEAVQAKLADDQSWAHEGNLNFVDNQFNRSAGTIRVRAVFPNHDLLIRPGQFGRVRVPSPDARQAILVPDSAIIADQSRKIVMTVKDDGTVEPRVIEPGPTFQGLRVVRSGLSTDDNVIIDGVVRARPGAKVTPQPGKIAPDPQAD